MSSFSKWLADVLQQSETNVRRLLDDKTALHFLLTWSLFESKCFNGYLEARNLKKASQDLHGEGFQQASVTSIAQHFHTRYQDSGKLENLLHDKNTPTSVANDFRHCLSISFNDLKPDDILFLALVVVYRYRNNMFHGNKGISSWLQYTEQIQYCTLIMQAFTSHAESITPTLAPPAVH